MAGNNLAKTFKFNLVPPKTKEEILQLEERDNTLLYSFLLIFFSVFMFFVLTLLQVSVINSSVIAADRTIAGYKDQISALGEIKSMNGELFIKSQALDPLLEKDIKLNRLIQIADEIIVAFPGNVTVINYEREETGEFVITFLLSNESFVTDVMENLKEKEAVENALIRRLSRDTIDESKFQFTVIFKLTNIE